MRRLHPGMVLDSLQIEAVDGRVFTIGKGSGLSHLQFRRFAGCPICNLHVHEFRRRHAELQQAGLQELIFFHSPRQQLLEWHKDMPFALIADPNLHFYRRFAVERGGLALLHPRAWWAGLRGLLRHGLRLPAMGERIDGLPADFLLDGQGRVLACHYGQHADDQWSVAEVLQLAATARVPA